MENRKLQNTVFITQSRGLIANPDQNDALYQREAFTVTSRMHARILFSAGQSLARIAC